jgi:hypothetical protein
MRRTGKAATVSLGLALACALVLGGSAQAATPVVTQEADRTEVGTDDTFIVTVKAVDAPSGSSILLADNPAIETISTSRGMQSSIQFDGSGPHVRQTATLTVRLRATKPGKLVLGPAELHTSSGMVKSQPLTLTVKPGHVADSRPQQQRRNDPFGGLNPFGQDDDNPFDAFTRRQAPSDRDLFIRTELDKREVFQGEQVTLSTWIYARVDLSRVDAVTQPKLDGFWTEDVESPKELTGETRMLDGVPYRAYLLKRLALFPVKAGSREIGAVEADITTGFLFAGRREHRASQPLTLKVKPLPPGAPPGFQPSSVGTWTLTTELTSARAELGTPVSLRVLVDGRGNVKDLVVPRPALPVALKLYDPSTTDKVGTSRGRVQGRRVQEYLVLAQQTGTFEIPAMDLPYFDPDSKRYEHARSEPISFTVVPGPGSAPMAVAPGALGEPSARNVLNATALRPLRVQAVLDRPSPPWRQPWFVTLLLAPPVLFAGVVVSSAVRKARSQADPRTELRRRAQRARGRLSELARRKEPIGDAGYCAEVDTALRDFLSARLGTNVTGLTREALEARLAEAGAPADVQARLARVQDACDEVRFAPGVARLDRAALLADAEALLDGWEAA